MGAAVSSWQLANATSKLGALGVISGTALATVVARRLKAGDPDGAMRRAMAHFPIPAMVERVLARYFVEGGKAEEENYTPNPMPTIQSSPALTELTVVANFTEVFLAKAGHSGVVGINLLEKIQVPTLASLYGAMLAGVDYVLMGAGIPRAIPGMLDSLAEGKPTSQKIDVVGALPDDDNRAWFDPAAFWGGNAPKLNRPLFLAIVASATLALTLARKSTGQVNGFVVEYELAGGHNAPPRGPMQLDDKGEPIYGPRDVPELHKIAAIGLPFWLAGSYAKPEKLKEALAAGAAGIQVGTAFAFCNESGLDANLRRRMIKASRNHEARVFTDPLASPTGFPFKVASMSETLSEDSTYQARKRVCDLGYLRQPYRRDDGTVGYRCASEPVENYIKKGGTLEATTGRKCLCNGLMATVGLGQVRHGITEPPIVTAGNEVAEVARLLGDGDDSYSAADVMRYLQGKTTASAPAQALEPENAELA